MSGQQALTEVGDKLKAIRDAHGKDAIAMYYGNPNGHNFYTQLCTELFINMLGTERFFSAGSVDEVRALSQAFTPEATAAITGISAEGLRALVHDFNRASMPVLYGRIGLCTQEFGTLASWLVEVVNILCGRQDVEGGAMFGRPAIGNNEPTGQVNELKHSRWFSRARGFPEYMSMLPASW